MTGMRKRNINLAINNKMTKWLNSLPEHLQKDAKKDLIVTGGCIASMLMGERVNDYDVYFKTYETTLALAHHYLGQFIAAQVHKNGGIAYDMSVEELTDSIDRKRIRIKIQSAGIAGETQENDYHYFEHVPDEEKAGEYVQDAFDQPKEDETEEKPKYRPVFLSSNAITLSDDVQIILRFWGDVEEIHRNFDFIHCQNYWTFNDGVTLNLESVESLMSKTLVYNGSLYPICSIFRMKKFIQRGWQINAGQTLKMALQISKLDLTSFKILEEQLTGVDAAYFSQMLSRAQDKENPEIIDTNYLVEIINRMF